MDRGDVEAYLRRGWHEAAELKRRHWAEVLERQGAGAALRAAEALRLHLEAVDPGWPTPEERRADLESHIRLRRLLDRAAHAFANH